MLIDLTLGKHLSIYGEIGGVYVKKVAFAIQYQQYLCETKQSRAKLTPVSIETFVRPIDWWQIWWPRVNFGLLFHGANFFHKGYLAHFLLERDKIWQGAGQSKLIPLFRELCSGSPASPVGLIPCIDMHQSFTHALVKWFFDNFPMFADSFSVLSIHYVAREYLGAIL